MNIKQVQASIAILIIAVATSRAAVAEPELPPRPPAMITAQSFHVPGPDRHETRDMFVWRPEGTVGSLPVLYMTDGFSGLTVVAHQIAPYINTGEAPPIMIVAAAARPSTRVRKDVPAYRSRNLSYERHRDWFLHVVIPWAEATQGASTNRLQRGIGGYSNGADFAIALAGERRDLFGLVFAQSPFNPRREWALSTSVSQRWLVTGGTWEPAAEMARLLGRQLSQYSAFRRICVGPWEHDVRAWRTLSRGNTMWLFGYTDLARTMASEREAQNCRDLVDQAPAPEEGPLH